MMAALAALKTLPALAKYGLVLVIVALLGALSAAGFYIADLREDVERISTEKGELHASLTKAQETIASLEAAGKQLKAVCERQNEAVGAIEREAQARAQRAERARADMEQQLQEERNTVTWLSGLLKRETQKALTCEDALKAVREGLGRGG